MKYNLHCSFIFNKKGNSLVQVIVAAGIASIIALGVAQMMSDQNKEVKALSEKLLTKELELQMKSLLADSDYCNCAFNGKTFDITQAPPVIVAADQFTRLVNGYSAPIPTCTVVGGNFIPTVGTAVPGSTMTIGSIGLGGLTQVSPGVYRADLSVGFNNSIRSMKSIKTNVQFAVKMVGPEAATAKPFVACGSGAPLLGIKNATTITIGEPVADQLLGDFHLCIHQAYRGGATQGGTQNVWKVGLVHADGRYTWHGQNVGGGGDWIPFFDVLCFDF